MRNICLYHRNCTDGKMAAYVMSLWLSRGDLETEYVDVNYGEPMPDVTGCHVYIVDFSYKPEALKEASKVALSITMLDHHLTAADQWGGYFTSSGVYDLACPNYISIREDRSGAGMALEYVLSKDPTVYHERLYNIVAAVQDRDLWKFKLPDTKVVFEAINGLEGDFNVQMGRLIYDYTEEKYQSLLTKAKISLELRERLASDYVSHATLVVYEGHTVPIINIPPNFASRVGELLAFKHPFAILYNIKGNKVNCSLRSNTTSGVDVSAIAARKGGGGHLHASGFRMTMEELVEMLSSTVTGENHAI